MWHLGHAPRVEPEVGRRTSGKPSDAGLCDKPSYLSARVEGGDDMTSKQNPTTIITEHDAEQVKRANAAERIPVVAKP